MSSPIRTSIRPWVVGFGLAALAWGIFLLVADHPGEIAAEVEARVSEGKKPRAESEFAVGLWWAAFANFVLSLLLLGGARHWARRLPAPDGGATFPIARPGRAIILGLLAAMALGGAMRWNLAHRSLWWDELWGVKYGVVGYYLGDAKTPLAERRFGEGSWQRALWHYTRPMNHPAASLPARLSHVAWKKIAKPAAPHEFSDFAIHLPNWLAAIATIGAVGCLGGLWGRPLAGLLAALLLAVHPWHIRYGVDLRGYSWLILWTTLGLVWLTLLFRENRSRWWPWWAFGINQALLVWSFPHGAVVAAAFFGFATVQIHRAWREKTDRATAWLRLLLVNSVAAMLYLQIFGPNLFQMVLWWKENTAAHSDHPLDAALLAETFSRLLTGSPWSIPGEPGFPQISARSWQIWLVIPIAVACVTGLIRRERGPVALLLAVPVAAGTLLLLWFATADTYYYSRFLSFLLVPFCLAVGLALDWRPPASRYRVLAALTVAISFVTLATPQWDMLFSRPYAPMRDVSEVLNAASDLSIIACYGHGSEMLPIYAPDVRAASSLAELKALAAEARSARKGLLVTYGYPALNRAGIPDGFEWLDDPAIFQPVGTWQGIEPDFEFRILRWTGAE